jgi:hypothetical protein
VGVTSDVIEDLLRSGKGCLGIDDPLLLSHGIEVATEGPRRRK